MAESGKEVEVNGKVDLGTRRLLVSHVENATSFFAYTEAEKDFMKSIKLICKEILEQAPKLAEKPVLEQLVGVYSYSENSWYRGRIEQLGQGKSKSQYRVRMVDFGWNNLFSLDVLRQLPESLESKPILCEKYRMADLKPKGRAEGYSAEDRLRGGEWLKRIINNRVVISSCYRQVNYAGGIMADCMVGDINLNKAALKQGHALLVPSIIASLKGGNKRLGHTENEDRDKNLHYNNGNQLNSMFNSYPVGMGGMAGNVDLDYSSYNGSAQATLGRQRPRASILGQPRPFKGQATNGKSVEVKRLEKKINEDRKTINVLKKTTNLDVGIKDVSKLMDKVNLARSKGTELETKGNVLLSSLAGVAEVIEESCEVSTKCLDGVEAVEAARRRVTDLQDATEASASHTSKTDFQKCISLYLEEYSEEVIDDQLYKVNRQLTNISSNIPSSWKLLEVNANTVTKAHLMEVAGNINLWMEESVSREAALTANSKKEMESLCLCLEQLSHGLRAKETGDMNADIPTTVDTQLGSARRALQAELTGRKGTNKSAAKNGRTGPESADMAILKSAWKALQALRGQLQIAKEKKAEYETLKQNLESDGNL